MRPTLILAALLLPVPAFAQDAPAFEGPRVEGLVGYEKMQSPYPGEAADSSGLMYGVAAGYDVRRGPLVLGGEVELTGASTDTRADGVNVPGDRLVIDAGRDLYLGGRAGLIVAPTVMLYGKLGLTDARVDRRYTGGTSGNGVVYPPYEDSNGSRGVRLGAGAEVATGGNVYVKGEYRYATYGGDDIGHRHQLVLGAGFRF